MLRSGFILGMSAPAAILTLMVQPVVRDTADKMATPITLSVPAEPTAPLALPGMRPASIALSPTRVAGVPRLDGRSGQGASESQAEERILPAKPRRAMREGCEAVLSSLVGPEARRMQPGRCIS